jgi:hypothetical protein
MKITRKNMIFFLALVLLILSIIYRLMNPYVQPRVAKLTYTGSIQRSETMKDLGAEKTKSNGVKEDLAGILKKVKTSPRVYRDLFALYTPAQTGQKEKTVVSIPESSAAIEKDPIGEFKDYIASYRFYGSYNSEGKKAVFLAKNKLVLVARIGDRLDGKYLIDDIQDDFIRIKALELNETIDVHLGEFNDD